MDEVRAFTRHRQTPGSTLVPVSETKNRTGFPARSRPCGNSLTEFTDGRSTDVSGHWRPTSGPVKADEGEAGSPDTALMPSPS